MLNFLSENMVVLTLSALALVILLAIVFLLKVAIKHGNQATAGALPASATPTIQISSLKQSFRRAVELIENNLAERSERYNLSWTLVINGVGTEDLPVSASGLQSALSSDSAIAASVDGVGWGFYDKGVAVQLQASQLGDPDNKSAQGVWDEFLSLCRSYRPDRPFDSIVFTLPAASLLDSGPESMASLLAMAKGLSRRLWLAQHRFALQFPVYIVVSGCEKIPGFSRFSSALPSPMRRSILGWSSPNDLSAPFQERWIDQGMDEITMTLSEACTELSALELPDRDCAEYFLLPSEVNKLRQGLRAFMDELMRPSAYHDPFLLRGFYLTGDSSESAVLLANTHPPYALAEQDNLYQVRNAQQPAFLRDLFEKKIFPEIGLVRSSRTQKMRRPAVHTAVRWGTGGFVAVWLLALGLASLKINYVAGELVVVIEQFNQETRDALRRSRDETFDIEKSKDRALRALRLLDSLNAGALWALPMPGSWSYVDDLNSKVQNRIADGFAKTAFDPIRISLNSAVADMTGASIDSTNGSLLTGSSCGLPKSWSDRATSNGQRDLEVDEQAEFVLLEQYVRRAEELQRAVMALARLTDKTHAAHGEDLRLLVKVLMGVELNGNTGQIAEIFRKSAPSGGMVDLTAMRQASACAFGLMFDELTQTTLSKNYLLYVESRYSELIAQVSTETTSSFDGTLGIQAWDELSLQLRDQASFLQAGKGVWIQRRTPEFGANFDKLMQAAKANSLLGPDVTDAALKRLKLSFAKFLADWDSIGSENATSLVGKLDWNDKDNRWVFNAERQALSDALVKMLALPYVKNNSPKKLTEANGASVSWDRQRLDQALAYGDIKRALENDLLLKFPAQLKPQATRFLYGALTSKVLESTSQAMLTTSRPVQQVSLTESDQPRLARLVALLNELGASDAAATLKNIISRDIMTRLRLLDDAFVQANLFLPRDPEFKAWSGAGSPLVHVYEASDAAGLAAYVAQQVAYIENATKEAEPLLQILSSLQPNHPLVQKWLGLSADVARSKLKSPTSSLGGLVQFLQSNGSELEFANCIERLSKVSTARRNYDMFADRLQALQSGLLNRCAVLKDQERRQIWTQFSNVFNRDLSGRWPFKSPPVMGTQASGGNSLRLESPPADMDDVATSLTQFDRVHKTMAEASSPSVGTKSSIGYPPHIKKFEEQFLRVRQLLAPLFPLEPGSAAGYDVSVDFRANLSDEKEGGRIIDWSVSSGNQILRLKDSGKTLYWEPGLPIVVSLRIAKDSPLKPIADAKQSHMSIEEKTVSYRFNDPWALFSILAVHKEAERNARADGRVQVLRFEFPLQPQTEDGKNSGTDTQARVFLRMGISPAGKKTLLAWPSSFPTKAPEW